jgi:hypothetical protein
VWHPILAAEETEPGHWVMLDQYRDTYGDIRLVRRGAEIGYRGLDEHGELVGYYRTLRAATDAVHEAFLRNSAPAASEAYAAQLAEYERRPGNLPK